MPMKKSGINIAIMVVGVISAVCMTTARADDAADAFEQMQAQADAAKEKDLLETNIFGCNDAEAWLFALKQKQNDLGTNACLIPKSAIAQMQSDRDKICAAAQDKLTNTTPQNRQYYSGYLHNKGAMQISLMTAQNSIKQICGGYTNFSWHYAGDFFLGVNSKYKQFAQ